MGYIGGTLQQAFVERVRGAQREQLLAVPVDVGKHTAMALVSDFWGQVVAAPLVFELNDTGFEAFRAAVRRAGADRQATWIRVGLEEAGNRIGIAGRAAPVTGQLDPVAAALDTHEAIHRPVES